MNRFFKLATLTFLLAGFMLAGFAAAVPDPADSVIIESKVVDTVGAGCNVAPAQARVRIMMTNKDSLANITIPFLFTTMSGGAYAALSRPGTCGNRNFGSMVAVLISADYLKSRVANISQYHSSSPDTMAVFFTITDPLDDLEKVEPSLARRDLLDLKFDSVTASADDGQFSIDSGRVLTNTIQFVNLTGGKIEVNFVMGVVTVNVPTDVKDIDKGRIPTVYSLDQNYPNPFNANTQISFALPKAGNARLDIYNVLGQKVSTLFNEFMNAGSKTVNWDGRDDGGVTVPSGVYFYQLVSQDYRQTKKMLLIK